MTGRQIAEKDARIIADKLGITDREIILGFESTLLKYWENKIAIIWSVNDIIDRAKYINKKVSIKRAEQILDNLYKDHDGEIGINWDTIDTQISQK